MKQRLAWILGISLMAVWAAGCNEKKDDGVATAPPQEPAPMFPPAQEQAAEPQPPSGHAASPHDNNVPPPVDTAAKPPAEQRAAKSPKPKEQYSPPAKNTGKTYVVQKGDTLQSISQKHYKTTKRWRDIYNANRGVLKKGPNDIQPGMKLQIP